MILGYIILEKVSFYLYNHYCSFLWIKRASSSYNYTDFNFARLDNFSLHIVGEKENVESLTWRLKT